MTSERSEERTSLVLEDQRLWNKKSLKDSKKKQTDSVMEDMDKREEHAEKIALEKRYGHT